MKKSLRRLAPLCIMISLFTYGCVQPGPGQNTTTLAPATKAKVSDKVLKGKVVGRSNKARTISIKVGKGDKSKTVMVKFDDRTKGLDFAVKGHAAIIKCEKRGKDLYALSIKPKLAKLPAGVTEIKPAELKALLDDRQNLALIDSRPAKRYHASHLPGAVSIPVDKFKELASLLPTDKDRLLIFYCGGPT
ncbi:rhodanese-like domain-containing protein [Desulfolithobacter sp.]